MSINSPAEVQFHHKKQTGITLIMVLIFIITLSLVSAISMTGITSGERVIANELDKTLAFQAAESAAREAAAAIEASTPSTLKNIVHYGTGETSPYNKGTLSAPHPLGGNAEFWRTTSALPVVADCSVTTAANTKRFDWSLNNGAARACYTLASSKYLKNSQYANAELPRYVIEMLPKVAGTTEDECWFRITARATGGSSQADVILQLNMFKTIATGGACLV